ncbi:kinase [Hirsutella rhossiliensis]|uniref:EKC/KEOPS complex subunit BUD32 n=1 Tax=Hirsutella rhossiliensis TaxID=111463 RepID=A0A9P8MUF2_9HYPO|nr:kinase [Hirsutella rhossiliensis]KAH0960431.1 kinase [Hirsutella rhossiliensis]
MRRRSRQTDPKDLVGAEAQRQIDLFVRRKNGQPPDAAHDWGDVGVIGELEASSNNKKATLLLLGRYVRDIFSCRPTRCPGAFDIHEKPERFLHVIAGYTMMNDGELGLDTFTELDGYVKISELLEALRDAMKAHKPLYLKVNILHRDISENNIIITDCKATGLMGMLIDLDLAKELGSGRSGARCRTGTMEFMAIEVLRGISHAYRHDLESFFYVLLARDHLTDNMFTDWYNGSFRKIASAKRGHMDANGFEEILEFPQPEFDCVKPFRRELRSILFPYSDGLFIGTPKDPEVLYGATIEAFDKAIDDNNAMER